MISFIQCSKDCQIKNLSKDFDFNELTANSFNLNEIDKYSFDYTFISSYNDIVIRLKSTYKFDLELSAGSTENNTKIKRLLEENASNFILIKNVQFLPPAIKSGTNRFIFVIEPGENHNIIEQTRIVYYDKKLSYDSIFNNITIFMNCSNYIVKFHSAAIYFGHDFSIKDLQIALNTTKIDQEYILEIIYYNRLSSDEINKIKNYIN